jgi:two-component system, chemotaxis family, CheB/CheR fusion protein
MQNESELFIIGIGASAGGMDAIHTIFDHTPSDAVSYVIIQHLSPDYQSFMAELLVKHSKLKIFKVENGMEVVTNCVYVMPEGKYMTIAGGKLMLKDRQKSTSNSAVDIFFNSLAEDLGNKSIGIVLSGNGADGTKGVAAIKKVGGMVIVQDPGSTEFGSMPASVIDSGYYDYILPPKLIPQQIVNYIAEKTLIKHLADPASSPDEPALLEIIELIRNHTPLDFSDYKRPTIVRRIIRRMVANNAYTIADFIQILKINPKEIEILAKEFLISVTNFFRDPKAFDLIREKVIPEIVEHKLIVDTFKVWVIGCATGEEAYSLAILIKEHLTEIDKDLKVKIFASDIDKNALEKAAKGFYPLGISRHVSQKRLDNFFIKEENGYLVRDDIRNMIIFANHDIVHHPPYGKIDFISCRNLLIYLNPSIQKKIFSTLHFCLNIGGYLFLGPSEGIGELKEAFLEVDKKWKIFKNIEESYKKNYSAYSPNYLAFKKSTLPLPPVRSSKSNLPARFTEIILQSHLEASGYQAGIVIDENHRVIQPFGAYENFLLPKLFKNLISDLLPLELSIAAGTSIKKALQTRESVTVKNVTFQENEAIRSVRLLVKPFISENEFQKTIFTLYFREEESVQGDEGAVEVYDQAFHGNKYLADLEQELAETKLKLQEACQSIDDSNDSIQSYNEELLSGNEELQSSNEELQSINEELNTLNSEFHFKIKELADLNDDFNNYFRSTYHGQIYVDKNIIIKKFTPVSISQINLRESDIGRSLADISTNIKFSSLIEDIQSVIDTQTICEKQIQTYDGNWYAMMILPYLRSNNNSTDGAIITFNDISSLKRTSDIIERANSKLLKINEEHNNFIFSVSHDLKSPLNNMEGLLSLMKDSNDLEELKSITVPLITSVIKLKETIDELSDITRIEFEMDNSDQVDLHNLLEEVKWSIRDTILNSNVNVQVNFEEKEIRFSRKNLRSIVLNLLSNAIKYRSYDREPKIIIKTEKVDDFILLSVQDNGIGIAKEKVGKLFTKFNRLHDLATNVEGIGIGLFLVKKIISNAGGTIEVESELGKGTCFKVYFKVDERMEVSVSPAVPALA